MNDTKLAELEERSIVAERADLLKSLEARQRVNKEIRNMVEEGEAFNLSNEEIKMLQSFRRFKLRQRKLGEVFKWQSFLAADKVECVEETGLILHPNE